MVALDVDTGKLKWHFQFSPHDGFDYDAVQVPVLADLNWTLALFRRVGTHDRLLEAHSCSRRATAR